MLIWVFHVDESTKSCYAILLHTVWVLDLKSSKKTLQDVTDHLKGECHTWLIWVRMYLTL